MANLAEDRITELSGMPGKSVHVGIKAAKKAYLGVLALIDADGYYNPDAGVTCSGIVTDFPTGGNRGDNTAAGASDGGEIAVVSYHERRTFDLDSSALPTDAHIGKPVFAKDNHTLSLQPFAATGVRPYVGLFAGRDGDMGKVDLDMKAGVPPADLGAYRVATSQTLLAATVIVINDHNDVYPIAAAAPITLTADLPDGVNGQRVAFRGSANAITFSSAISNLKLVGAADCPLGTNSQLVIEFDGTNWQEISRSLNS
jgi:hypothetical protein